MLKIIISLAAAVLAQYQFDPLIDYFIDPYGVSDPYQEQIYYGPEMPTLKPDIVSQGPFLLVYEHNLGLIAWASFNNFAEGLKMFTWMQRLEQRVGLYDSSATEIIVNDLLEDINYVFELEKRANELVMDGSIF